MGEVVLEGGIFHGNREPEPVGDEILKAGVDRKTGRPMTFRYLRTLRWVKGEDLPIFIWDPEVEKKE